MPQKKKKTRDKGKKKRKRKRKKSEISNQKTKKKKRWSKTNVLFIRNGRKKKGKSRNKKTKLVMALLSFTNNRHEKACFLFISERQTFVGLGGKCLNTTQTFSLFLFTKQYLLIFSLIFFIYPILPSTKHTLSHIVATAILP